MSFPCSYLSQWLVIQLTTDSFLSVLLGPVLVDPQVSAREGRYLVARARPCEPAKRDVKRKCYVTSLYR